MPDRRLIRPAYMVGSKADTVKQPMFTCPRSAIPEEVWQLLMVWEDCRLLGLAPPKLTPLVRVAFRAFAREQERLQALRWTPAGG